MSLYDYHVSKCIEAQRYPFYAIIMAAMRKADTDNLEKLKSAWPLIWEDMLARYNAARGVLEGEEVSDTFLPPYEWDGVGLYKEEKESHNVNLNSNPTR